MGTRFRWAVRSVGVLVVALLAVGCGGGGVSTYPVRGKVTLKGGDAAKLAGGSIVFVSAGEPKVDGGGELAADGSFDAGCYLDGKPRTGLPAGDYKVFLRTPRDPDDAKAWTKLAQYLSGDKTPLKTTVTSGTNTPTFEVEAGR